MLEWLKRTFSSDWERVYVVETRDGQHRYRDPELARNSEWLYAYAGTRTERRTEWEYVGDDDE